VSGRYYYQPRPKNPYIVFWGDEKNKTIMEGFDDPKAVNDRLNELWAMQRGLNPRDGRWARAFTAEWVVQRQR